MIELSQNAKYLEFMASSAMNTAYWEGAPDQEVFDAELSNIRRNYLSRFPVSDDEFEQIKLNVKKKLDFFIQQYS